MGKRQTGPSATKVFKHPHKTKKRLATKKVRLASKAKKRGVRRIVK